MIAPGIVSRMACCAHRLTVMAVLATACASPPTSGQPSLLPTAAGPAAPSRFPTGTVTRLPIETTTPVPSPAPTASAPSTLTVTASGATAPALNVAVPTLTPSPTPTSQDYDDLLARAARQGHVLVITQRALPMGLHVREGKLSIDGKSARFWSVRVLREAEKILFTPFGRLIAPGGSSC